MHVIKHHARGGVVIGLVIAMKEQVEFCITFYCTSLVIGLVIAMKEQVEFCITFYCTSHDDSIPGACGVQRV